MSSPASGNSSCCRTRIPIKECLPSGGGLRLALPPAGVGRLFVTIRRLRNGLWNATMCTHIREQPFKRGLLLCTCAIITSLQLSHVAGEHFPSVMTWISCFFLPLLRNLSDMEEGTSANELIFGRRLTSGLCTLTSLVLVGVDRREENSAYCTPRTRPQEWCTEGFSQ